MGNCHSNAWGKELFKQEKGSIARGGASPLVLGLKVQNAHFLDKKYAGLSKIRGTFLKNAESFGVLGNCFCVHTNDALFRWELENKSKESGFEFQVCVFTCTTYLMLMAYSFNSLLL